MFHSIDTDDEDLFPACTPPPTICHRSRPADGAGPDESDDDIFNIQIPVNCAHNPAILDPFDSDSDITLFGCSPKTPASVASHLTHSGCSISARADLDVALFDSDCDSDFDFDSQPTPLQLAHSSSQHVAADNPSPDSDSDSDDLFSSAPSTQLTLPDFQPAHASQTIPEDTNPLLNCEEILRHVFDFHSIHEKTAPLEWADCVFGGSPWPPDRTRFVVLSFLYLFSEFLHTLYQSSNLSLFIYFYPPFCPVLTQT